MHLHHTLQWNRTTADCDGQATISFLYTSDLNPHNNHLRSRTITFHWQFKRSVHTLCCSTSVVTPGQGRISSETRRCHCTPHLLYKYHIRHTITNNLLVFQRLCRIRTWYCNCNRIHLKGQILNPLKRL